MNKKFKRKFLNSSLILFIIFISSSACAQIKVGMILDLSGPGMFWGKQTLVAIEVVKDKLKEEGLTDKIIFKIEDSGLNSARSVSAVQKLIQVDQVDALFVEFTPIIVATYPLIKKSNKFLFYNAAAESPVQKYDFSFKGYLDYRRGCQQIATHLKASQAKTKIGMLKEESEYAELCFEGIKSIFDDVIVEQYQRGSDVKTQVLNLKSKGANVVFNAAYPVDFRNMLMAMQKINYKPLIGFATSDVHPADYRDFAETLEGSIGFGYRKLEANFIESLKQYSGFKEIDNYEGVAVSQLHLYQFARSLIDCNPSDKKCLFDKMQSFPVDSLTGFTGFKNRVAQYDFSLKVVHTGELEIIK